MPSQSKSTVSFLSILKWSDDKCREYLEAQRWPDGPVCPKCGTQNPYRIERRSKTKNNVTKLYRCRECRKDYTATVGSIFEDSKIPLQKWFAAIYLMAASKKGMSAHQLHRQLEITYKSAWFMCHRIREAMKDKSFEPLRGVIEADETYVGGKLRGHAKHRAAQNVAATGNPRAASLKEAYARKTPVFGIVERGGRVRTQVIPQVSQRAVERAIWENVDRHNARMFTDEHPVYHHLSKMLPHGIIRHKSEYVRGEIHTQGIESYWAILKRGLYGTFHHVDAAYLSMYLPEFEYRYNRRTISDAERFASLISQTSGRRVTWFCRTKQPENPFA
jgi:transposase-like protein